MLISGSALAHNSNSIIIKFLLVGSFGILFWGMGLYAVSKGYSRNLGFLLGLINWVGVIILFCLNDNDEQLPK
jgi:formylmethanofuran dehydrogenase subunit B